MMNLMNKKIISIVISIFIGISILIVLNTDVLKKSVNILLKSQSIMVYKDTKILTGHGRKLKWSIGIMEGKNLNELINLDINPIITLNHITDYHAVHLFDPFYVFDKNVHYLFYEVCGYKKNEEFTYSCDIAYSYNQESIKNKTSWLYGGSILDEDFKLSFSNIIKLSGEFYMIPESSQDSNVKLYKASNFPKQWQYVKTLIKGEAFNDPTPFSYKNKWYMFVSTNGNAKMSLYMSDKLDGDWIEHPLSPVILNNPNAARSAGKVIEYHGKLIRFSQNTFPKYGKSVNAHEISVLTPDAYKEKLLFNDPILVGDHITMDGIWTLCII